MTNPETQDTPTAEDIACHSNVYQVPGSATTAMLRPYWREHPELGPPFPGTQLAIAMWRDGTVSPVPKDAGPRELSAYYSAALATGVLREMAELSRGKHQ